MRARDALKVMRHNQPRRTSAHLDAILEDRPAAPDALTRLVAAAKAPGQPSEMAGLQAATAVFTTAAATPDRDDLALGTITMPDRRAKAVAAKFVATVAAVLAVGGVAYAATTVGAPNSAHTAATSSSGATSSRSAAASGPAASSSPGSGSASASDTSSASDPSASNPASVSGSASVSDTGRPTHPSATHPSAAPNPSLVGLCRAWLARPTDAGKADQSAAFTVLVTAAGGKDNVTAYCTIMLTSLSLPGSPTGNGPPTISPTHRHGKPSPLPTPSHPGRKPTSVPPLGGGRQ
jgi:hypothetical protein